MNWRGNNELWHEELIYQKHYQIYRNYNGHRKTMEFCITLYQCFIMSAIDIGVPTIQCFQDGLIMEPCSMMVLVCNVLLFDVLLLAIFIIYAAKKFPAIKENMERKWTSIYSQKEDDSKKSVSNTSTMVKEIMTVDKVVFEAE